MRFVAKLIVMALMLVAAGAAGFMVSEHRHAQQEQPVMAKGMSTEHWRRLCIRLLGGMGRRPDLLYLDAAEWMLDSEDRGLALTALSIMSESEQHCRHFKARLLALAEHEDPDFRAYVSSNLECIAGDPDARQALTKLLHDPDPWVQFMAAISYGRAYKDDAAYAVLLKFITEGPPGDARRTAIGTLIEYHPHRRAEFKKILSEHPDPKVRFAWEYMLKMEAAERQNPCDDPDEHDEED